MLIQAYYIIEKIEKIYIILIRTYKIPSAEIKLFTSKEAIFQISIKEINDIISLDGLISILLVVKAYL